MRLTHIPTGIVIYSQTEKSQLQNKEKAFRLLRSTVSYTHLDVYKRQVEVPTEAVDMRTYAMADGEGALKQAKAQIGRAHV